MHMKFIFPAGFVSLFIIKLLILKPPGSFSMHLFIDTIHASNQRNQSNLLIFLPTMKPFEMTEEGECIDLGKSAQSDRIQRIIDYHKSLHSYSSSLSLIIFLLFLALPKEEQSARQDDRRKHISKKTL